MVTAGGGSGDGGCGGDGGWGARRQQRQRGGGGRPATALLLVSDQRARLEMHLEAYGVQLATLWHYAASLGYGLELYTHDAALPPMVPGHFVKVLGAKAAFALGYEYVLGLDWDMYIPPFTAVPLSVFFAEWPRASVIVQGESNMCTGAVLYRRGGAAAAALEHWWALALTGCCWRGPLHDQVAFKHMLQDYLANYTGDASLYPPAERAKLARNRSPRTTHPAQLLGMKKSLQNGSDFGFVGLEMMLGDDHKDNYPRVGLHSCHGLFWGCIPDTAPALLMHTGHKRAHLAWIQHRMLAALHRWVVLAGGEPDGQGEEEDGGGGSAGSWPGLGPAAAAQAEAPALAQAEPAAASDEGGLAGGGAAGGANAPLQAGPGADGARPQQQEHLQWQV